MMQLSGWVRGHRFAGTYRIVIGSKNAASVPRMSDIGFGCTLTTSKGDVTMAPVIPPRLKVQL